MLQLAFKYLLPMFLVIQNQMPLQMVTNAHAYSCWKMSPKRKIMRTTTNFPRIIWKRGDFIAQKVDPSCICELRGVYTTEEIINYYIQKLHFCQLSSKQRYFRQPDESTERQEIYQTNNIFQMNGHFRSKYAEFPSSAHRPSIALSALHAARKEVLFQRTRIAQKSFEKCSSKINDLSVLSVCALKHSKDFWQQGMEKAKKARSEKGVREAMRLINKAVEIRVRSSHVHQLSRFIAL